MSLTPASVKIYHVFLASPGDVAREREVVRQFFNRVNTSYALNWKLRFEVVDWENYASFGVGRPQELITRQTLDRFRDSLALVVGLMWQRFGTPTGKFESGTEEEFTWAWENNQATSFPEIKWFFRKVEQFIGPADPKEMKRVVEQWEKVHAFRERLKGKGQEVSSVSTPTPTGSGPCSRRT